MYALERSFERACQMFNNMRKIKQLQHIPLIEYYAAFTADVYKDYLAKWKMLIL